MRVLVTGANGFVGRHLCGALETRGHVVIGAGRAVDRGDVLPLDLLDPLNIRGVVDVARPDAVAHLAAQSFVPDSIADPWTTHDINAGGTLRLLEAVRAARDAGGTNPRMLIAGSADVYGAHPPAAQPLREATATRPASPYAASKIAAEAYAIAAYGAFGMRTIVTRAFNHIGPGQDERFVATSFAVQLARIAAGGDPLLLVGNLDAERDFLDVRDVVAAYIALLESDAPVGDIYNVASGRAVAMKELLAQLVRIAHVGVEIRDDPDRLRPADMPLMVGDAGKLRAATGWEPVIPLDRSLRDIYADACERVAVESRAKLADR